MYSVDGINYQNEPLFTDLLNGEYTLSVKDENDCEEVDDFTIAFNSISAETVVLIDITCVDENDGVIEVTVDGGTAPFQYSLNGMSFQDSNIFDNLSPGAYVVTVRDSEGFTRETNEISLIEPDALEISVMVVGNEVSIIGVGGSNNFTFSLDGVNFQDDNLFTELPNGTYTAYIKDENDCILTEEFTILVTSTSNLEDNLSFELLPNPNAGIFTLRLTQNATEATTFTILDVVGKIIYTQDLGRINTNFETTIDASHLSSGVYIAHVKSGDALISKRLVLIK